MLTEHDWLIAGTNKSAFAKLQKILPKLNTNFEFGETFEGLQ